MSEGNVARGAGQTVDIGLHVAAVYRVAACNDTNFMQDVAFELMVVTLVQVLRWGAP